MGVKACGHSLTLLRSDGRQNEVVHKAGKGLAEHVTNGARGQDTWVTLLARDSSQVS